MSDDEKHIHLTVSEMMALVAILDKEREWTRMLINQQPTASLENVERQTYIKKLDMLSSRLTEQIG